MSHDLPTPTVFIYHEVPLPREPYKLPTFRLYSYTPITWEFVPAPTSPKDGYVSVSAYIVDRWGKRDGNVITIGPYRLRVIGTSVFSDTYYGILLKRGARVQVLRYSLQRWWRTFKWRVEVTRKVWGRL